MPNRPTTLLLALLLVSLLSACAPMGQRTQLPHEWIPSPNYNERRPNHIIIHHTTNETAEEALRTLTLAWRELSAHYLIGRDGKLYQLVDERYRAWHAGDSYWGGTQDLNSSSIGIELDNTGNEPYSEPQISTLLALLKDIQTRHRIPSANIIGHGDIAPARKVDPSRFFPWRRLAMEGYGLWCDAPYQRQNLEPDQQSGDPITALQALGYNVSDPAAALAAFRRHFGREETSNEMSAEEGALLQCLIEQKRVARSRR